LRNDEIEALLPVAKLVAAVSIGEGQIVIVDERRQS